MGEDLNTILERTVLNSADARKRAGLLLSHPFANKPHAEVSKQDFFKVARLLLDHIDRNRLLKERKAVEVTGYSPREVEEFRDIFCTLDRSGTGQLQLSQIRSALENITERKQFVYPTKSRVSITGLQPFADCSSALDLGVNAIISKEWLNLGEWLDDVDEDSNGRLDFPEFLCLMWRVENEDWCSINSAAAAIAQEEDVSVRKSITPIPRASTIFTLGTRPEE